MFWDIHSSSSTTAFPSAIRDTSKCPIRRKAREREKKKKGEKKKEEAGKVGDSLFLREKTRWRAYVHAARTRASACESFACESLYANVWMFPTGPGRNLTPMALFPPYPPSLFHPVETPRSPLRSFVHSFARILTS